MTAGVETSRLNNSKAMVGDTATVLSKNQKTSIDQNTFSAKTMQSLPTSATANNLQSLGLISNQQSFNASNNIVSPAVEGAIKLISKNLNEKGVFNDVTHSELLSINKSLKNLTPKQTNEAITHLSDENLKTWTSEISSYGILGSGGLKSDEQSNLLKHLVADLKTDQLARLYNATDNKDFRQEMVGLISDKTNARTISATIDSRIAKNPTSIHNNKALLQSRQLLSEYQDASKMSRLSADSYLSFAQSVPSILPAGITRLDPDKLPQGLGINKTDLDHIKSGFSAAVYQDSSGNKIEYIVAFRGTEDGTDWVTNGKSAVMMTEQYKRASRLMKKVELANKGQYLVRATGHSLGAGLSNYIAVKYNIQSTGFNSKGTALPELFDTKDFLGLKAKNLIKNYQVKGEVLTTSQEMIKSPVVMFEAPGEKIKIPAIRPDGSDGNMITESIKKLLLINIPFIGIEMAEKHDISGPIDRHGMGYVERGMNKSLNHVKREAIDQLLQSFKP